VHLDPVAVALVVDEHQRVLMLWRYRFPVDQWGYELPGGRVKRSRGPAGARWALREHLMRFEPLPGQLTAPVDAFLWRQAEHVREPTDREEAGRLEWLPLARVPELARRGELLGSGALVPLLFHLVAAGAPR
jgi:non-ribosomal peptide synthetase component F